MGELHPTDAYDYAGYMEQVGGLLDDIREPGDGGGSYFRNLLGNLTGVSGSYDSDAGFSMDSGIIGDIFGEAAGYAALIARAVYAIGWSQSQLEDAEYEALDEWYDQTLPIYEDLSKLLNQPTPLKDPSLFNTAGEYIGPYSNDYPGVTNVETADMSYTPQYYMEGGPGYDAEAMLENGGYQYAYQQASEAWARDFPYYEYGHPGAQVAEVYTNQYTKHIGISGLDTIFDLYGVENPYGYDQNMGYQPGTPNYELAEGAEWDNELLRIYGLNQAGFRFGENQGYGDGSNYGLGDDYGNLTPEDQTYLEEAWQEGTLTRDMQLDQGIINSGILDGTYSGDNMSYEDYQQYQLDIEEKLAPMQESYQLLSDTIYGAGSPENVDLSGISVEDWQRIIELTGLGSDYLQGTNLVEYITDYLGQDLPDNYNQAQEIYNEENPTDTPDPDDPVEPPTTEPPVTEPPTTEPPVTEPPTTQPPTTNPGGGNTGGNTGGGNTGGGNTGGGSGGSTDSPPLGERAGIPTNETGIPTVSDILRGIGNGGSTGDGGISTGNASWDLVAQVLRGIGDWSDSSGGGGTVRGIGGDVTVPDGGEGTMPDSNGTDWGGLIDLGLDLYNVYNQYSSANDASRNASNAQVQSTQASIDFMRESRDMGLALNTPFIDASYEALDAQKAMAGLSSSGNYNWQQDPGYQFRLEEGQKAVQRSAAAKTGALSGAAVKAMNNYTQDYASAEYGNIYNRLGTLSQLGQTSASNSSSLYQRAGEYMGDSMQRAGDARASGYVGNNNANQGLYRNIAGMDWGGAYDTISGLWNR